MPAPPPDETSTSAYACWPAADDDCDLGVVALGSEGAALYWVAENV